MSRVKLLASGSLMPTVGLGTFMTSEPELVKETILKAIEVGYRHIDTAYVYGNEGHIGDALEMAFQRGMVKREDMFIVTKLPCHGHQPDKVGHFLRQSLSQLKLDYVDMYLIHQPLSMKYVKDSEPFPTDPEDNGRFLYEDIDHVLTWKEMEKMVDQGLVKNIGLSNFNSAQVQRVYDAARIKPACLQVECHLYLQQWKLQDFCKGLGMTLTAYAPFGSPQLIPYIKAIWKRELPENPKVLEDPIFKELCQKYNKTPAQISLRWLNQRGIVVIPKSSNEDRIKQNLQIFDFSLTSEEIDLLKKVDKGLRFYNFILSEDSLKQQSYPFGPDVEY